MEFFRTRPSCLPQDHCQSRLGASSKQPVLTPGSLPASDGRHSSAPGPAGCRVLIRVPWPARSPCHLHAELRRPEYCLADRSSRPRDEIEVVQVGLLCRLGTSPGLGQMPRQLNARLAVLQVDRLRRHVRLRQQGRRRAVVQAPRRRAPDGRSGSSAASRAASVLAVDRLLLWRSSALHNGHDREEEETHRGDADPGEVVLVPMLVPVLRDGSAGLALCALARDARPVMHSHVMPGCVLCRPAAGRSLALALLERPVQPASRSADLDLPVRLRASRQQHEAAARRSKASQQATHWAAARSRTRRRV